MVALKKIDTVRRSTSTKNFISSTLDLSGKMTIESGPMSSSMYVNQTKPLSERNSNFSTYHLTTLKTKRSGSLPPKDPNTIRARRNSIETRSPSSELCIILITHPNIVLFKLQITLFKLFFILFQQLILTIVIIWEKGQSLHD